MSILTGLAWLTLVGYLVMALECMIGGRTLPTLAKEPLPDGQTLAQLPRVSVIIPARNEERHIEEALTSVLHLDYPNYELLVLDDRSTDQTGAILERMSQQYPQLRVIHIQELPDGWLGKNYALYTGAQAATGDLLLFTDADIVMNPNTLQHTVAFMQRERWDHVAMMPEIQSHGPGLSVFMNTFSLFFALYARPWYAPVRWLPYHIGIGAFNLIRASVYRQIGTHQAIALRPDDDMKLGKLVKKYGFRQVAANGLGLLRVEWYRSLRELIDGLSKNAFAGLEYSIPFMLVGITGQFLFGVWPVLALFLTDGPTQAIYGLSVVLMQLVCLDNAWRYRLNLWGAPAFPLSTLLLMSIIVRTTVLNIQQDGIRWRGTHYALEQLKQNRV